MHTGSQCRRYGGARGAVPPLTTACAPISVYSKCFLEHYVTTRQQAIMDKRIIMFKDDSRLKFSRFFLTLLATNYGT